MGIGKDWYGNGNSYGNWKVIGMGIGLVIYSCPEASPH